MQVKGKFFLLVLAVTLVFAVPGCTSNQPAAGPETIKIGLVTPLTGDVATFGESTRNAVELLVKEVNDSGGLLGKEIQLFVEDDRNDPTETANAVQKLISQNQVSAIIGSVASKCTLSGAPIAQQSQVVMISPTSTNVKVTETGDYIFRACFIDPFQGAVMAKFAANTLSASKAAMLYDITNDYTKGLAEAFAQSFGELGGTIVASETYSVNDQDFRGQLTKIKAQDPEVLFLPDYYNAVGLIAKQARELGITAVFLGGDGWDSPELVPIAGDSIEGGYFSNHYSPENKSPEAVKFITAYQGAYGNVPDALAALAYDAAGVLFDSIERANSTDSTAIRDALANTTGYRAVSGTLSFDENRNPIKGAAVLKIENGQQVFVEMVNP